MKKFTFCVFAVLLAVSLYAQTYQVELSPKGSVSSYTKTSYTVVSRFGDYYRTVSEREVHLLQSGREIEVSLFGSKDEPLGKSTFLYDPNGKKLSSLVSKVGAGCADVKSDYEYEIDASIKSITDTDPSTGEVVGKSIFKREGEKITENRYDGTGKLESRVVKSFDSRVLPVEEVMWNGDGTFAFSRKISYLENAQISTVETFGSDGECSEKVVFKYDTNGFLTEVQVFEDKIKERRIFKNDPYGNPTRISYYEVAQKFGTTVNELFKIEDFTYSY